ncbi:MAG: S8 family serine peptidase [candidate division WOR-3 bacterium]
MKKIMMLLLVVLAIPVFALISPDLKNVSARVQSSDLIPIDIVFKKQMDHNDLSRAVEHLPKPEKRAMVAEILRSYSLENQKPVLEYLKRMEKQNKVKNITSIWVVNAIYCEATKEVIAELDKNREIFYIDYDLKPIQIEKPEQFSAPADKTSKDREIAWGVSKINAPAVWALGYTGQGIVVGIIDTGVNYNHVDLADHIWTDPNYPNHGWNFELNNNDPMDVQGHGTHCAGSVSSDGTAGSQCGVAPDAQMLCCRVRTVADTTAENQVWQAMQFVVSPPLSPTHGGDLITMSLGWVYAWYPRVAVWRTACNNVGAAGIVMIVAAGNERGYTPPYALRCPGSVPSPWRHPQNGATGAQSNVISIGATDINDAIASFSSPGPVTWDTVTGYNDYAYPPGLTKPDVSAPGVNIKSCAYNNNNGYADGWSGTSMATPHTAGTVALMLQKNPYLTRAEIDSILQMTAVDLGTAGKDNDFGAGRIDALAAVNATPFPGAPFTPTIIAPFNYAKYSTLNPVFKLTTTDPQNDMVKYRIYWSTDTAFTNQDSITTGLYASGAIAIYTLPVSLTNNTTYWWRVRAADSTTGGTWSAPTARRSFTIKTDIPSGTCSWFQTTYAQFVGCTFNGTQVQGDSVVLVPTVYAEDTLLFANFESGMPAGWTWVDGNNDGIRWTTGTTSDIGSYAPPNYGTAYAYYSDDDAGSGVINYNEELISPRVRVPTTATSLRIRYGYGIQVYQTGEKLRVKFRKRAGGSWTAWTNIAEYTTSANGTADIDLTSQLPCDSVQFEWFYSDSTASSHWGWACATDNVLLYYSYTYQNNTGVLYGSPVIYSDLSKTYARPRWGDIVWRKATAGDSIGIQVEYYTGSVWQLVPNSIIPGNSTGKFTTLSVDTVKLNLMTDTVTYNTIRPKALFYRMTKSPNNPALLDWEVGNLTSYVGIADAGFETYSPMLMVNPNPFRNKLDIRYMIHDTGLKNQKITLVIYDVSGRMVKSFNLESSIKNQASSIVWFGDDDVGRKVPAGVYFIQLESDNLRKTEKAILLR